MWLVIHGQMLLWVFYYFALVQYFGHLMRRTDSLEKILISSFVIVVQLLRHVQLFVTPWTAACQASLSFTISWGLLKLMSTESVMPSNHHILCRPLLVLPSIFPSIRVFSSEPAVCIKWPNLHEGRLISLLHLTSAFFVLQKWREEKLSALEDHIPSILIH